MYALQLTIPPNTTKENASRESLELLPCIVTEIIVQIPDGCSGLVPFWIEFHDNQVLPANPGWTYKGDDAILTIKPGLRIVEKDYILDFRAYNEDDTYYHTLYFTVNVTILEDYIEEEQRKMFQAVYSDIID